MLRRRANFSSSKELIKVKPAVSAGDSDPTSLEVVYQPLPGNTEVIGRLLN
jgi:hypothetical protein